MDISKSLAVIRDYDVELAIVANILLSRLSVYKKIKGIVIPLSFAAVFGLSFYRPSSEFGILDEMLRKYLSLIKSPRVRSLLIDSLGTIIILSTLNTINMTLLPSFDKDTILDNIFLVLKSLPFVQSTLSKELNKFEGDFQTSLKSPVREIEAPINTLPETGRSHDSVLQLMRKRSQIEDMKWKQGQVSGAVYFGDEEHLKFLNEAFSMYSLANPLHADLWPSVNKFESEIIAMAASLVKGDNDDVCGCTTSGGTESIILAIKAHRDYYREKYHITHPELIAATSAHAAVDKACDMLGIKLVRVPLTPQTLEIDVNAVFRAVSPNTIMIYSSAPNFPHGVIDPVEKLAKIALQFDVGLHVDCCLGGFVLPFAKRLGYDIPNFDFSVKGVTSMSLDPHKYGFTLKGSSIVLYGKKELRQCQYFCYPEWTGGIYTTPTIAGSRSGGIISQCWASMVTLGEQGYRTRIQQIVETTRTIAEGVRSIPGLKLLGPNNTIIVCFAVDTPSYDFSIYTVADQMTKKGWALNSLQHPSCVHICCTFRHVGVEAKFVTDLKDSVAYVQAHPELGKGGSAAVYGMTSSLPAGPVKEVLKVYNDVVLDL